MYGKEKGDGLMNDERKRILKMVEEGLISADEAADLLESLEKNKQQTDRSSSAISTEVDWENQNTFTDEQHSSDTKSFKNKLLNFVEDTIKKVKHADLDFNFGTYYHVSHIYQYSDVSLDEVDLDIENGSVTLQVWDEKDVRVECNARVYQVENEQEAKEKMMRDFRVHTNDGRLTLRSQTKKIKLDLQVYVPDNVYTDLHARLFNVTVKFEGLSVDKAKVKTSNGKIHLYQMEGKDWEVESANGSVRLEKIVCDECEVETMNGSIHLDGDFGKVETQTINGMIRCYWNGEKGHTGFFKTTAGSIHLYLPENKAIDGELKTNIGSVQCHLPVAKMIQNNQDVLRKSMRFQTSSNVEQYHHIEAETKTGSIKVQPLTTGR